MFSGMGHSRRLALVFLIILVPVAIADEPRRPADSAGGKPHALLMAQRAREAIRTSRLEILTREYPVTGGAAAFRTWRSAGSDVLQIDRGDERGVLMRSRAGPEFDVRALRYQCAMGDEVWLRTEDDDDVFVVSRDQPQFLLLDLRCLGLDPTTFDNLTFEQNAAKTGLTLSWSQAPDGGLVKVTTSAQDGGFMQWWIDPARDWSVVRTRVGMGAEVWYESVVTLQKADGVWFPSRVQVFLGGSDPSEVVAEIEVLAAEFNRPEHPQRFTPEDIGVETGMLLHWRDESRVWDGEKPVTTEEYFERRRRGEIQPGPTVLRSFARHRVQAEKLEQASSAPATAPATTRPAPRELSEWEAYVVAFIRRHDLDAGQTERAIAILRDCQDLAGNALRRIEFESGEATGPGARAAAEARARRAREEVQRIFERRLVPRLEALLTSAQRERAVPG